MAHETQGAYTPLFFIFLFLLKAGMSVGTQAFSLLKCKFEHMRKKALDKFAYFQYNIHCKFAQESIHTFAPIAQRIKCSATNRKTGGSNPFGRATKKILLSNRQEDLFRTKYSAYAEREVSCGREARHCLMKCASRDRGGILIFTSCKARYFTAVLIRYFTW